VLGGLDELAEAGAGPKLKAIKLDRPGDDEERGEQEEEECPAEHLGGREERAGWGERRSARRAGAVSHPSGHYSADSPLELERRGSTRT
jgi:hypothetical protein